MVHVMHHDVVIMTTDKYYYTALNVLTSAIARSILLTHTYERAPLHPIYSVHPKAAASDVDIVYGHRHSAFVSSLRVEFLSKFARQKS